MRLEKITVNNFRQLKNIEIEFKKNKESDLHILIAKNGTGKTNTLNAINWCLYDKEPHLSAESQQLPRLNLNTIKGANKDDFQIVSVELWVGNDIDNKVVFKREETFRINEPEILPTPITKKFTVTTYDENNNATIFENEEADTFVERFVPSGLREFFFFDGERLDKYFIDATGQKISKAIFEISQIDLLSGIEDKLTKITKDLEKEASKLNPKIDEINNRIDSIELKLTDCKSSIVQCEDQITISNETIKECEEYLLGLPDIEKAEKQRQDIDKEMKEKSELMKKEKISKQNALFDLVKISYSYPAIKKTLNIINEKRSKKELPPNIDKDLLEKILQENKCVICDRELEENSRNSLQTLLENIRESSEIGRILVDIENPLNNFKTQINFLKDNLDSFSSRIKSYNEELTNLQVRLEETDKIIGSVNNPDIIREKHNNRVLHTDLVVQNRVLLQGHIANRTNLLSELDKEKINLEKELKNESKAVKINQQLIFLRKSIDAVINTRKEIMEENRLKIENETQELFLKLIWKLHTFKSVGIDINYNINLIHEMGYECLGSISAAERELLALSFTLALHKVSGFESPLIIDTPVARVSDTNRENFAKVLNIVSKNKQTILLFTPDEYSNDVSKQFDTTCSNKFELILEDEKETKLR